MSFAQQLLRENESVWRHWLPHPFTRGVAEGSIAPAVFQRWLAQDYLFVHEGIRFLAVLISKAPSPLIEPLVETAETWRRELALFRRNALAQGVALDVAPHPATRAYLDFLFATAHRHPFLVGWAALYGVEQSYHDAWRWVAANSRAGGPYGEWVQNWASDAFAGFTRFLAETLDAEAAQARERELKPARQAFAETARHEAMFWDMALGTDGLEP
ncbi:MAG: hypothetical protein HY423_08005 [Candidatus Lambdaproteobacteria bacterium]|nr:hypothetical protein [Candidatus Lambdaproteobacteria bacterium]